MTVMRAAGMALCLAAACLFTGGAGAETACKRDSVTSFDVLDVIRLKSGVKVETDVDDEMSLIVGSDWQAPFEALLCGPDSPAAAENEGLALVHLRRGQWILVFPVK